jgi:peroxiredoxin
MNRKYISFFFALLFFCSCVNSVHNKRDTAPIPHFEFKTLKGEKFTENDLGEKPVVLVYSNNECGFCAQQNREITLNIDKLRDAEIIIVTPQSPKIIQSYRQLFTLDSLGKIRILSDQEFRYPEYFGTGTMPAVYIYDGDHRFVRYYDEQTNFSTIRTELDSLVK